MASEISTELMEKSLLGTMLKENYLILDGDIQPELFQSQIHRSIYMSMQQLARKHQPVDYITLLTTVNPEEVGGANFLASLQTYADLEKFDVYLDLLKEEWREKEKHNLLLQASIHNWSVEEIQKSFDNLQMETVTVDTDINNVIAKMAERPYIPMKETRVVPTNLKELEKLIVGFRQGELTIIAGRPSMGKTDVMNYFALTAGFTSFLPIIFSLEMSKAMLIDRLIAACGKISRLKMRDPYQYFSEKQRERWISILTDLSQTNIQIDDRAGLTVNQMRAQVRRLIHTHPERKPIIFIDYLQIIHPSNPNGNLTTIIGQISWELKQMAKEFDCPVVCLAQLNRSVESRQNKRPFMSDLRDSGNIEQDADVVILLYRDSYYEQMTEILGTETGGEGAGALNSGNERLELIVAKNRNGPTGTVFVNYNKMTGQIKE